jgi:hypothetical protein
MMNERLAEFLLQAAREAVEEEPTDTVAQPMVMYKKFAELIVRECAQVAVGYVQEENCKLLEDRTISTWDLKCKIEEHFGVE